MKNIFCIFFLLSTLFAADITVVTMAVGDKYYRAVEPGIENKQNYCDKHGYDFVCCSEHLDPSRPISWSKVLLLLQLMEESESEWFFWTDADSLVMNLAIPLEDFTDNEHDLIIASGMYYGGPIICAGQFLIRNCERAKQFLTDIYGYEEYIDHEWWEQRAMIAELEQNRSFNKRCKVLAQRLLNSYLPPKKQNWWMHDVHYQSGDFILHFAGYRMKNRKALGRDMALYSKKVLDSFTAIDIDSYLNIYGFALDHRLSKKNIGYISPQQQAEFAQRLKELPNIRSVAEIGLNGGHSLFTIVQQCPNLEKILSFDLNVTDYSPIAVEFFKRFYRDTFTFVEGNTLRTVSHYASRHKETYDLIYIDGDHRYRGVVNDILNCRLISHEETVLWLDDYYMPSVKKAIDDCVRKGVIELVKVYSSGGVPAPDHSTSARCWVEAKYLPPLSRKPRGL